MVNGRYAQTELLNIQFNYFLMNCDNVRLRGEMTVKYSLVMSFSNEGKLQEMQGRHLIFQRALNLSFIYINAHAMV